MSPERENSFYLCDRANCAAIREILDRVGDKWSLYIIASLYDGPMRFNTIKREVNGISQRMLTLTLRSLERDGLLTRSAYASVPPRVEYELTPPWPFAAHTDHRAAGLGHRQPHPHGAGAGGL